MKGDGLLRFCSICKAGKASHYIGKKSHGKDTPCHACREGARLFAISEGMPIEQEELSPQGPGKPTLRWKENAKYQPVINIRKSTIPIGMVGMDENGAMAGSCTTSGLAYKMHGRVGDSPIIGAGLFVDEEVGAATATGLGEGSYQDLVAPS